MMKKKLTSLLVAAVLALSFGSMAACGGGTTSTTDKPNSSTSTPDQSSSSVPEVKKYTITVENGTGGGTFEENSKVTVKAEDKGEDYLFAGWKVGAEIVSTDKEYEVTVTADKTLVATYTYRYSVWDGTTPENAPASYVVDETAKTVAINDAEAFAYWRSLLTATSATDYYRGFAGHTYDNTKDIPLEETDPAYQAGYTININCDIDLSGQTWMGIDGETPMLDGCIINGNNHIIKGMTTTMQSTSAGIRGWATGGFFTMLGSNQKVIIKDLTFKNASVTGGGQIGVVVGGVYRVNLTLDNITVKDSYIHGGTGHKVGALIGRVGNCGDGTGDHEVITVKNCTVKDTTIAAMRNIGALIGAVFSSESNIAAPLTLEEVYKAQYGGWETQFGPTWEPVPGYDKFVATKAWFEGALAAIKDKSEGKESVCTWTQAEATAQIPSYQRFITTAENIKATQEANYQKYIGNNIDDNLTVTGNTVNNVTLITWAPESAEGKNETCNSAALYTYNNALYDNYATTEIDAAETNTVETVKKIDTYAHVKNTAEKTPVYIATAENFGAVVYATMMEATDYEGVTDLYIAGDIDMTEIFAENTDYAEVVLPALTIHLVAGAKLVGVPESVLANVTFVNVTE